MVKHTKVLRCKINDDRIIVLKKNRNVYVSLSSEPEKIIDFILEKYPNEEVVIKTEKSEPSIICNGNKNKAYVRYGGKNPPIKDTTEWLYLIKKDGTVWTIVDKGVGKRFVGKLMTEFQMRADVN